MLKSVKQQDSGQYYCKATNTQGGSVESKTVIITVGKCVYMHVYVFLMRDEKEERKKKARSNKQTRQSNTAHPSIHVHVHGKVTALGVLCCFALFVCLTLLASFFVPSHLSLKTCIYSVWCLVSLVVSLPRPSPSY